MWQSPYPRHTQRARLRRLGAFACLAAVLLTGFILGRSSRAPQTVDQVYLYDAPSTPSPTVVAGAGRTVERRAPLGRVARRTQASSPAPRVSATPRPSSSPENMIGGFTDSAGSRHPLRAEDGGGALQALSDLEDEVVRLVNAARRQAGCAPLRIDPRLAGAARAHSAEMAASGDFSHTSPDGSSPWKRMEDAGYSSGGAENIGRGSRSAEEALRNWMADPGHRGNILNCALRATGVGVVDGPGGPWWTQDFGYS